MSLQLGGLYAKVARKTGVDASFVSRVARGQRTSSRVERVLRRELETLHAEIEKFLQRKTKKRSKRRG
jgi:transcriptional regulator with XRE-family HTH domain